jgi:ferredoxin
MRVEVDYDRGEANAICMGIVPEVFEVRDDGQLYLLDATPPEQLRGRLEEAVRECATEAISIVEA